MKRTVLVIMIVSAVLVQSAAAQPRRRPPRGDVTRKTPEPIAQNETEKKILAVLDDMDKNQRRGMMNVSKSDGRLLRMLTEMKNARCVMEIGTSNGYSSIWICLGLLKTGGKLMTYDIDEGRTKLALENFRKAGVDKIAVHTLGDAHKEAPKFEGEVDILFLDADKAGYLDYLEKLGPKVKPGGLIIAHNTSSHGSSMKPFLEKITKDKDYETLYVFEHSAGMSISMKKRPLPEKEEKK